MKFLKRVSCYRLKTILLAFIYGKSGFLIIICRQRLGPRKRLGPAPMCQLTNSPVGKASPEEKGTRVPTPGEDL